MGRQFKVRAKKSFVYKEMGQNIEIKADKIYDAQEINVTASKTKIMRLGIWIKPDVLLDFGNYEHNFEEIS